MATNKSPNSETDFDSEYTELKVSSTTFFTTDIQAVAIPLTVKCKRQHRGEFGSEEPQILSIKNYSQELERIRRAEAGAGYTQALTLFKYTTTPRLALDHPIEDETVLVSLPLEDIAEFITFNDGFTSHPARNNIDQVDVKIDGDICQIKNIGEYEIFSDTLPWISLDEFYTRPTRTNTTETVFTDDSITNDETVTYQDIEERHLARLEEQVTQNLRQAWAKANDCYNGVATVEQVSPTDDSDAAATVTISCPGDGGLVDFTVSPPSELDTDKPVVRFVEEVGGGTLENAELHDCYVSFEKHSEKVVATSSCGLHLYVDNPTPESESIAEKIRSKIPF